MYVRIKRHNQTFFVRTVEDHTMMDLKEQVCQILHQHRDNNNDDDDKPMLPTQMRLLLPGEKNKSGVVLEDSETIRSQSLPNDAILHLVFRIGKDEWEEVDVPSTDVNDL